MIGKDHRHWLVAVALGIFVGTAPGQGRAVMTYAMEHAVQSKYLWRGFALDDSPVLQQGVRIGAGGFTAGLWGSFGIGTGAADADEVDYSLDCTQVLGRIGLSLGHIVYDLPSADLFSREFYAGLSVSHPLSPRLTWYHDYGDEEKGGGKGDYVEGALEARIPLGGGSLSWSLRAMGGYNRRLFIRGEGFDATLGTGLTWAVTKNIAFNPGIAVAMPFGALEDGADGGQTREFYAGFRMSYGS